MAETAQLQAFEAVKQFVQDLWAEFGPATPSAKRRVRRAPPPLKLYKYLLEQVPAEASEAKNIDKFLQGFGAFFRDNAALVLADGLDQVADGARIPYSASAYIPIGQYLRRSRGEKVVRASIRSHLLTIAAMIEADDAKADAFLQQVAKTEQGGSPDPETVDAMFGDIMEQAKTVAASIGPGQAADIPALFGTLMSSGAISKVMDGVQRTMQETGDPQALVMMLMSRLKHFPMFDDDDDKDVSDLPRPPLAQLETLDAAQELKEAHVALAEASEAKACSPSSQSCALPRSCEASAPSAPPHEASAPPE